MTNSTILTERRNMAAYTELSDKVKQAETEIAELKAQNCTLQLERDEAIKNSLFATDKLRGKNIEIIELKAKQSMPAPIAQTASLDALTIRVKQAETTAQQAQDKLKRTNSAYQYALGESTRLRVTVSQNQFELATINAQMAAMLELANQDTDSYNTSYMEHMQKASAIAHSKGKRSRPDTTLVDSSDSDSSHNNKKGRKDPGPCPEDPPPSAAL
jgi:hypothetical protein